MENLLRWVYALNTHKDINKIQYRQFSEHPKLGAANYKLAHRTTRIKHRRVLFCMYRRLCFLPSATEADGLVCNGMSNYNRNSPLLMPLSWSASITNKMFKSDVFGGMKMRRDLGNPRISVRLECRRHSRTSCAKLDGLLAGPGKIQDHCVQDLHLQEPLPFVLMSCYHKICAIVCARVLKTSSSMRISERRRALWH